MNLYSLKLPLIAGLGALGAWAVVLLSLPRDRASEKPRLQVEQLTPVTDGAVTAKSMKWIEVKFRVTNVSSAPVVDLGLEPDCCGTRAMGPMPAVLSPGAAFETVITVQAPSRGKAQYRVPLYAGRDRTPLAWLATQVESVIHPPLLGTPFKDVNVTTVAGDQSRTTMRLITVERRDDPPWIEGLRCEPANIAEFRLVDVTDKPDHDPRYCQRKYDFEILPGSNELDVATGLVHVRVREELAGPPPPVNGRFETLSRLSHPEQIQLNSDQPRVQISVVDRLGLETPTIRAEAPEYVHVRRIEGSVGQYEVRWTGEEQPHETHLVVECGSVMRSVIPVRWELGL